MPARRLLLDAGPLIALFNKRDKLHGRTRSFFEITITRYLTTWPVLTEVAYFLAPEQRPLLLRMVIEDSAEVVDFKPAAPRMIELLERYRDHAMDLADASLVYAAEASDVRSIVTLDHSDYSTYRIGRRGQFRLVEW